MRSAMLIIPFKNLRKYIGELNKESSFNLSDNEYKTARRISWSINKVSKYTPWESKCLVKALTAQYLLSCSHIENTLYLGVSRKNNIKIENQDIKNTKESKKSDLVAHSWIRCGNYYVTGGDGNKFKIVAKFTK
jgi:phage terminase large subunit